MYLTAQAAEAAFFQMAAADINDLRVAFASLCDRDFGSATLAEMTAEARRQMNELQFTLDSQGDVNGILAFEVSMLSELLEQATGHDGMATVH